MLETHNSAEIDIWAKKSWRYWPARVESFNLGAIGREL